MKQSNEKQGKKGFIKEEEFNQPGRAAAGRKAEAVVERLIQEGMAQGKFSNLANEGKPLKIEEENPYVEEDMRMAYKVLENAGVAPPWIEMDKEVEAAIARARRDREEHLRWLRGRLDDIKFGPTHYFMRDLRLLAASQERWLQSHAIKLHELNQKIHSFNHVCPVSDLLKVPLLVDKIIEEYDRSCPAIPKV